MDWCMCFPLRHQAVQPTGEDKPEQCVHVAQKTVGTTTTAHGFACAWLCIVYMFEHFFTSRFDNPFK